MYPFEYINSFKKFWEDKLPDRSKFFRSVKNKYISEKKVLHAVDVWNTLKMNTMGQHHDLCLKTYVFLLADICENFINTCLEYYGLDPFGYFSSLGLSSNSMLKMTKIELELISDNDVHFFCWNRNERRFFLHC